jgi:hypothetical protein
MTPWMYLWFVHSKPLKGEEGRRETDFDKVKVFFEYFWCFCMQVFGILTIGIRALSLAKNCGKILVFYFADFSKKKKRVATL